jgi:hypothetical protein
MNENENDELIRRKGRKEYQKFIDKEKLSRKEAILAQCYICYIISANADELDCLCKDCPVYCYMPYRNLPSKIKNCGFSKTVGKNPESKKGEFL